MDDQQAILHVAKPKHAAGLLSLDSVPGRYIHHVPPTLQIAVQDYEG